MRKAFILIAILAFLLLPLAAQTVTLTSPNGGENWAIGSTATITWNSNGVATVRLILHKGGTGAANRLGIIAQGLNAASGSYSWTVGSYDTGTAVAGGDYYIRLKAEGADVEDFNDAVFALSAAPLPHFTLLWPNGGESWEKGSDHPIAWDAVDMPVHFRLLLLKDGQVLGTIKDNLSPGSGSGAIPWKAGDYIGGSASVFGGGYKVRIESVNGLYSDNSDNPFTITAPPLVFHPLEKQPDLSRLAYLKPDLVVCLRWDGGNPMIYQDKRVKVWVKNVGPVEAPVSTLKIYIEGKGHHLYTVPALAPNGQFYWTAKYDWPTCGHKTVRATADIHGVVNELNEENNVLEARVEVNCGFSPYSLEMMSCSDGSQAPQ